MAQAGYTPILLFASGTPGSTPSAGNLTSSASGAELAINYADGKLFYKDSGGSVQVIATKGGVGSSTNTQVLYNSSGLVVGSANLTFNGSTLTAGGFAGPLNGTVGATTPNTGAFTTLSASGAASFSGSSVTVGLAGVYDAIINTAESMYFNVDSNNDQTGQKFQWGENRSTTSGGTTFATLDSTGLAVTGTLSATDTISSTKDTNASLNGVSVQNANAGASAESRISLGTNSSAGQLLIRAFGSGVTANPSGAEIGTQTSGRLDIVTGGSVRGAFSSTGLAVTGTLSSTGAFSQVATSGSIANLLQQTTTNGARVSTSYTAKTSGGSTANANYAIGVGISGDNGFEIYDADAGALRAKFTTTGLAVTGTISATGNFTVGSGGTTPGASITINGGSNSTTGSSLRLQVAGSTVGGIYSSGAIKGDTTTNLALFAETGKTVDVYANGWAVTPIGSFSSTGLAVTGTLSCTGALSKGSGSFRIAHPLPGLAETHQLVHSFIEGPKADLIYRGKVNLVNGAATVNIDEVSGMTDGTFSALCRDVQCFTTNESDWTPVRGSVAGNVLTIEAQDNTSTASVSWMVIGERKDPHMLETDWTDDEGRVIVEPLKPVVEVNDAEI